jgi:hypothetical protein
MQRAWVRGARMLVSPLIHEPFALENAELSRTALLVLSREPIYVFKIIVEGATSNQALELINLQDCMEVADRTFKP